MSRRATALRRLPAEPANGVDARLLQSRLRKLGVALICAYVAFVPLVFDPRADWSFTVPKALLSHALAYMLLGVLAGLLITFGREAVVWSWLHVPVLAFLVVNVVATLVAQDRTLALFGTHARMLGLGSIAGWILLYFSVVVLIRTRADVVAIVIAGLGAAFLMLGYEAIQLLGRDPFRWNVDAATRPFSTNGQATSLAGYLTALSVASFACAVTVRAPRRIRAALLISALLLLAGAAATGTRSALIGLATGGVALVGLVWLRNSNPRARTLSVAAAAIASVAVAVLLTLTPVGARLLQSGSGAADSDQVAQLDLASLDVRAVLYQVAADVVREKPLLGYGPDNFVVGMTRYRPEHGPDEARLAYATSPHSWVAQIAVGTGLIGLGTFVAIVIVAFALTARSGFGAVTVGSATALVAYLGTGLTSVNDVGSEWLIWVSFGLIAVSTATASNGTQNLTRAERSSVDKGRRGSARVAQSAYALAGICVVAGVALAVTTVAAFDASRAAWRSQDARLVGRASDATAEAVSATSDDPGRAEYWQKLGLAYVADVKWRDAAKALERAVALAPWDVRYSDDLAQTQLVLANDGDAAARARAVQLVNDTVRRDPNYPDAQFTRALVMQFVGNIPEGIRSIERALTLSPHATNATWYVVATQLYVAAGRAGDGVRVAQNGLLVVESPQIRIELARALLANGQAQEALVQVDRVLATEPGNAIAQRLRVEILAAIPK
jgi:O-antigen ligase/tetratricopeptide (TPR) repeat protein